MQWIMQAFGRFRRNRSGSFATLTALAMVPLAMAIGLSVDLSTAFRARSELQNAVDAAALAIAASRLTDAAQLQKLADDYFSANLDAASFKRVAIGPVVVAGDDMTVSVTAAVGVNFMTLAGVDEVALQASAVASRAVKGSVEVSLVLDNTWSMSETDAKNVQKITALRDAATLLVNQLLTSDKGAARVAVVPYADYVNVGADNRWEAWLSVPADSTTTTPRTCKTVSSEQVCSKREPSYSCTSTTDGVTTTGTCTGACQEYTTKTYNPPKKSCSGGTTTTSTFFGCVGSRKVNAVRLADGNPSVTYPGFIATSQLCPTAILPLSSDKKLILASIAKMTPNVGSYKPATYIPAGLIWGLNTLYPPPILRRGRL